MICPICNTTCPAIGTLTPYNDKKWTFTIYDCPHCFLRFAYTDEPTTTHEAIHKEQQANYKHQYILATKMAQYIQEHQLHKAKRLLCKDQRFRYLIDYIETYGKGKKILELGCSTGFLTAYIKNAGYDITGLDISQTAVATAKKMYGDFFVTQTTDRFDIIIHSGVIPCVPKPKEFVASYLQLLSSGGVLVGNFSNKQPLIMQQSLWQGTKPPDLLNIFDERTIPFLLPSSHGYTFTVNKHHDYKKIGKIFLHLSRKEPEISYYTQNDAPKKITSFKKLGILLLSPLVYAVGAFVYHTNIYKREELYGLRVCIKKD